MHTTFLLKGLKKRQPLRSFRHRSNDDIKVVLRFIGSENDRSVLLAYSRLWSFGGILRTDTGSMER